MLNKDREGIVHLLAAFLITGISVLNGQLAVPVRALGTPVESADGKQPRNVATRLDIVHTVKLEGRSAGFSSASALEFSPAGDILAVGDVGGVVELFDVRTWRSRWRRKAHEGTVHALAFTADGRMLATGGGDGVALWEISSGGSRGHVSFDGRGVFHLAISLDGTLLAGGVRGQQIALWHLVRNQRFPVPTALQGEVRAIAASPRSSEFALAENDGIVLWDAGSAKPAGPPSRAGRVAALAFARAGTQLASVTVSGFLRLWEVDAALLRSRGRTRVPGRPLSLCFDESGRFIALASQGLLYLWDTKTGAVLQDENDLGGIGCASFSPKGDTLAATHGATVVLLALTPSP